MIDLTDIDQVKELKSNLHATFDSPQGQDAMAFIEQIGRWTPTIMDSMETNDIIARDANRRLVGTIKTILLCNAEQIVAAAQQGE